MLPSSSSLPYIHNILLDYELTVDDVLSGSGDLLGQYAYIRITSKQLDEITAEDIKEFADTVVDHDILFAPQRQCSQHCRCIFYVLFVN